MTRFEVKPIPPCPLPAYPTALQVASDPTLLLRHQPVGWLSDRELAVAASVLLSASLVGCGQSTTHRSSPALGPETPAVVAPLFAHGDGRGATGCVVLSPPVFLSEEEALAVIRGELRAHGVDLTQANVELAEVKIAQVPHRWVEDENAEWQLVERPDCTVLVVDGLDSTKHIAVEFVSAEDYGDLTDEGNLGTVTSFDCKKGARMIADSVRGTKQPVYFAAFYDPVIGYDSVVKWASKKTDSSDQRSWLREYKERRSACKEESQRLLRQQVKDFVDWLKAQGAI